MVSCDCFTVPTVTFKVLFGIVTLAHKRRRTIRFHITEHPTAQQTAQQIVEAFPGDEAPQSLFRGRDSISSVDVQERVSHMGIKEVKIAPRMMA